jgi:hypothetical protein
MLCTNQRTKLYEAERYSRDHQLCSDSILSQHFIESGSSLPRSQELFTCPHRGPDQSSPHHPIHPNVIHPPTSWSSQWSFSPLATCPAHLILDSLILTIEVLCTALINSSCVSSFGNVEKMPTPAVTTLCWSPRSGYGCDAIHGEGTCHVKYSCQIIAASLQNVLMYFITENSAVNRVSQFTL